MKDNIVSLFQREMERDFGKSSGIGSVTILGQR
jgi:hypothetical protein